MSDRKEEKREPEADAAEKPAKPAKAVTAEPANQGDRATEGMVQLRNPATGEEVTVAEINWRERRGWWESRGFRLGDEAPLHAPQIPDYQKSRGTGFVRD